MGGPGAAAVTAALLAGGAPWLASALNEIPGVKGVAKRKDILAPLLKVAGESHVNLGVLRDSLAKGEAPFWAFQEVIDGPKEPIGSVEYIKNGHVTEFDYGNHLANAFRKADDQGLADLVGLGGVLVDDAGTAVVADAKLDDLIPSDVAVVGLSNQDNQRGHGGGGEVITFHDGPLYDLAMAFMLAYPYGTPALISSYDYGTDTDAGRPADKSKWIQEDLRPSTIGMVRFRHETAGLPASRWQQGESKHQVAFSVGNANEPARGFTAFNNDDTKLVKTFQTGLPAGNYTNVAAGDPVQAVVVQVDANGFATLDVPPGTAVALHVGATKS